MVISKERLEYFIKRDAILSMLEAYGVDNWDGFDEAMEALDEE